MKLNIIGNNDFTKSCFCALVLTIFFNIAFMHEALASTGCQSQSSGSGNDATSQQVGTLGARASQPCVPQARSDLGNGATVSPVTGYRVSNKPANLANLANEARGYGSNGYAQK